MFTVDVKQQYNQIKLKQDSSGKSLRATLHCQQSLLFVSTDKYSWTSVARTPMGSWKLDRDKGSSSLLGLIKAPGQEA